MKVFHLAAGLRNALAVPISPTRIAASFAEACERWRRPEFTARRETVATIAAAWGWSEALLDHSLDALLTPFTPDALERLARRMRAPDELPALIDVAGSALENAPRRPSPRRELVGLMMPGNIPGAGIHELALGLIAGCALMVKTATAEPIFFARFTQTLREIDGAAGARVAVVNWSRECEELTGALRTSCDWIAAFGDDQTIARLTASDDSGAHEVRADHAAQGVLDDSSVIESQTDQAALANDPSAAESQSDRRAPQRAAVVRDARRSTVVRDARQSRAGMGELNEMDAARLAVAFGTRYSGALVSAEMATGASAPAIADAIARDISLFEQQGCLSPHHIFIELPPEEAACESAAGSGAARGFAAGGGAAQEFAIGSATTGHRWNTRGAACEFARELANALERGAARVPPPRRYGLEEAAALRRVRETARWRAIGGEAIAIWESVDLGWTVIYDEAALFTPAPGYRTVTVSPIVELADLGRRLKPVAGRIEAFAIAAPLAKREQFNSFMAGLGVCYLCEPGAMQSPPVDWNHGGGAFMRALAAAL